MTDQRQVPAPLQRLQVQAEALVWWVAIACAALLLLAPLSERTIWVHVKGSVIRDAAGWDWIALLSGIVAILTLAVARLSRRPSWSGVLGAIIAGSSFVAAALAAGQYWLAISRGNLQPRGVMLDPSKYVTYPAPGPSYFAVIAIIGVFSAFVLAASWLKGLVGRTPVTTEHSRHWRTQANSGAQEP